MNLVSRGLEFHLWMKLIAVGNLELDKIAVGNIEVDKVDQIEQKVSVENAVEEVDFQLLVIEIKQLVRFYAVLLHSNLFVVSIRINASMKNLEEQKFPKCQQGSSPRLVKPACNEAISPMDLWRLIFARNQLGELCKTTFTLGEVERSFTWEDCSAFQLVFFYIALCPFAKSLTLKAKISVMVSRSIVEKHPHMGSSFRLVKPACNEAISPMDQWRLIFSRNQLGDLCKTTLMLGEVERSFIWKDCSAFQLVFFCAVFCPFAKSLKFKANISVMVSRSFVQKHPHMGSSPWLVKATCNEAISPIDQWRLIFDRNQLSDLCKMTFMLGEIESSFIWKDSSAFQLVRFYVVLSRRNLFVGSSGIPRADQRRLIGTENDIIFGWSFLIDNYDCIRINALMNLEEGKIPKCQQVLYVHWVPTGRIITLKFEGSLMLYAISCCSTVLAEISKFCYSNQEAIQKHPHMGRAPRLVKASLQEAAKKAEMRHSDLKKIGCGVQKHPHMGMKVTLLYLYICNEAIYPMDQWRLIFDRNQLSDLCKKTFTLGEVGSSFIWKDSSAFQLVRFYMVLRHSNLFVMGIRTNASMNLEEQKIPMCQQVLYVRCSLMLYAISCCSTVLAEISKFHYSNQEAIQKQPHTGAPRPVKASLQEAAKKREMRYSDLKKIGRGVHCYFHDDIIAVVVFLDSSLMTRASSVEGHTLFLRGATVITPKMNI